MAKVVCPEKPCYKCKEAPRTIKSYCHPCFYELQKAGEERRAGLPCHKCKERPRTSYDSHCIECNRERQKKSIEKRGGMKAVLLRRNYDLSIEEWGQLASTQNGLCANPNCKRGLKDVDHDHKTGLVRGLLCGQCNKALGLLNDDPELIMGLILYLRGGADGR